MFSFSHQNSFTECRRTAPLLGEKLHQCNYNVRDETAMFGDKNFPLGKLKYPKNDFQARLSIDPTQMVASLGPPADDL